MRHARNCSSLDEVLSFARARNAEEMQPPLPEDEVNSVARSAWRYTESGTNWFSSSSGVVALPRDTVDELAAEDPYAFALFAILRLNHGMRDRFVLAKQMASKLGWTVPRFKAARRSLELAGGIRCVHPGGRGSNDPPVYAWGEGF